MAVVRVLYYCLDTLKTLKERRDFDCVSSDGLHPHENLAHLDHMVHILSSAGRLHESAGCLTVAERQSLTSSRDQWVDWFLQRLQQEPWAVGGLVVMGVFVLGALSLVLFALLFGCCRRPNEEKQRKKNQQKKSKNAVI